MKHRLPFPVRRPAPVLVLAGLVTLVAGLLAARLAVKADLSHLLPPSAKSVADLKEVQRRTQAFGNLLVGIHANSASARAAAAQQLIPRLRAVDQGLLASVTVDDGEVRRYLWDHRYQYVPLADLEKVESALERRIARANPLYVDLGDDDAEHGGGGQGDPLAALRRRLDEAKAKAASPTVLVAKDGLTQMIVVRATFPSTDIARSRVLSDAVNDAINATLATAGPGVSIGATGDVASIVVEQNAIVHGMALAIVITTVLVGLALLAYYRSLAALAAIFVALGVGTVAALGFARLSVGYLNSATAFLVSIVIGNGINFPMLVVARYLEERRGGRAQPCAVERAMGATRRGTTAAAFTAFVAYGSLVVTDFRGFRDFGIIGAVGMLLCWAAAYTVAPAALTVLGRLGAFAGETHAPALGRGLAALLPKRSRAVLVGLGLVGLVLVATAAHYIASDPFEYDLGNLRATGPGPARLHDWQKRLDDAFGQGISGGFVVAVEQRRDVPAVVDQLRSLSGPIPGRGSGPLLSHVSSLDDLVPADQEQRLALLAKIRRTIDHNLDRLGHDTAAEAKALRPPDGLRPITDKDVPADLALQYTEKDGTRGRLIFANTSALINGWDGRDLIALSQQVRAVAFPPGTRVAGSAFVFADIIQAIRRDGPKATLVAFLGVLVVIAMTMGVGRHGRLTALAAMLGTTAMLGLSSLAGIKINFLDFVALPLTLGIGTDYAANVLSRAREEGRGGARRAVLTTGGVVVLCSFTTIVGYASLLVANNGGIRSFGLAAMLGELTCIIAGVWAAPVLLDALDRRWHEREPTRI